MKKIQRYLKPLSLGMTVLMLLICVPVHGVLAALVPTDATAQNQSGQDARESIKALIDREDVRSALVRQGIDPREAKERVGALTDAEAIRVAEMMDELPAGGSAIGFLLVVSLVVFLVLLVTDLTGVTDVFPWVK